MQSEAMSQDRPVIAELVDKGYKAKHNYCYLIGCCDLDLYNTLWESRVNVAGWRASGTSYWRASEIR